MVVPWAIDTEVNRYLSFFFLAGQSPITTLRSSNTICVFIPAVISIILNTVYTGIGIYYRTAYNRIAVKELSLISNAHFTLELLTTLMVILQRFLHKKALREAISQFQFIRHLFVTKFDRSICPKFFLKPLCIILSVIFILASITCALPRSSREFRSSHIIELIFTISEAPILISVLHNMFYIDWIRFYVRELNRVLKENHKCGRCRKHTILHPVSTIRNCCIVCVDKHLDIIRNAKLCYYRIGVATSFVNEFFGLSIVAILLRSFSEGSVQVYSIYGIFVSKEKLYFAIGPFLKLSTLFIAMTCLINSAQYLSDEVSSKQ